ncbi:hypothetical protein C8R47DRAFT_302882 [Mycena vitilis]|nr:hypothetical protein C8R47DRAFT_302882 [Mycena vitilis]
MSLSANTLIAISILTVVLVGLEYAAAVVLDLLRGLAITKRFLVFAATSVALTLLFQRVFHICDPDSEEDRVTYIGADGYLYEEMGSESESVGHPEEYVPKQRARAPSPSMGSRQSAGPAAPPVAANCAPGFHAAFSAGTSQRQQETYPRDFSLAFGTPTSKAPTSTYLAPHQQQFSQSVHPHASPNYQQGYPQFTQSAPPQYSFVPPSSLLSQYTNTLPKRPNTYVMKPFRYVPSQKHPHRGFPPPLKDERFLVLPGLTFPNCLPRASPLPRRKMPRRMQGEL